MKKHAKYLACIILIFIATIVLELLSLIVVPIALLFCKPEDNHLPAWAKWWETFDHDINGDPYWQGPEHANGHQREYKWRVRWLLRNRLGTFSYTVLGFDLGDVYNYTAQGDVMTSNRAPAHSGFLFAEAHTQARVYPSYYLVKQWGKSNRCLRVYLGWKFRRAEPVRMWPDQGRTAFVFSLNPFQSYV